MVYVRNLRSWSRDVQNSNRNTTPASKDTWQKLSHTFCILYFALKNLGPSRSAFDVVINLIYCPTWMRSARRSQGRFDWRTISACELRIIVSRDLLTRTGPLCVVVLGVFAQLPQLLLVLHAAVLEPRFDLEVESFTLLITSVCVCVCVWLHFCGRFDVSDYLVMCHESFVASEVNEIIRPTGALVVSRKFTFQRLEPNDGAVNQRRICCPSSFFTKQLAHSPKLFRSPTYCRGGTGVA